MKKFFEFHCHSNFSSDANVSLDAIIEKYKRKGISGIALTDHDIITGAFALKAIAPDWLTVIVGEEINTSAGEIIGLFLKEVIRPGLSLQETIFEIKKQGGLVMLPHPFDRLRKKRLIYSEIEKNIDNIDIIEVFNARNVFESDNRKAVQFAKKWNKTTICGSDAHFLSEYGKTVAEIDDYIEPQNFLQSLKNANFKIHRASLFFHLATKYVKLFKHHQITT
jgi:predicted metal-dependent phosphoesterase TrpH